MANYIDLKSLERKSVTEAVETTVVEGVSRALTTTLTAASQVGHTATSAFSGALRSATSSVSRLGKILPIRKGLSDPSDND